MALSHVSPGDPHAVAHNAERDAINQLQVDLTKSNAPRSSLKGYFAIHKALLAGNATILAMGDSKTEGTGLANASDRWLRKLQDILRAQYSIADQGIGYIPAKYATFYDFADKPVISGTFTDLRTHGLGYRSIELNEGASVTFPAMTFVDGVPLKVHYTRLAAGGSLEVLTGGVVRATIDTIGTPSSQVASVTIPAGVTPVVIRRKASTGAVRLEGIFHSTSTNGVKVLDGSLSGGTFRAYGSAGPATGHWAPAGMYSPQGAIMAFGANDMSGRNPSQFAADAAVTVGKFLTMSPIGGVVILMGTERTETPESGTVRYYEAALKKQFSEMPQVSLMYESDLWMPKAGVSYTWGGPDGWLGDTVHTSAAAHTEIAEHLAEPLRPASPKVSTVTVTDNGDGTSTITIGV